MEISDDIILLVNIAIIAGILLIICAYFLRKIIINFQNRPKRAKPKKEKKKKPFIKKIIESSPLRKEPDIEAIYFDTDKTFWREKVVLDKATNSVTLGKITKIKLMDSKKDTDPALYIDKTDMKKPIICVFASHRSGVPINIHSKIREGTPTAQEIGNALNLPTLNKLQSLRETKSVAPFMLLIFGAIIGAIVVVVMSMMGMI